MGGLDDDSPDAWRSRALVAEQQLEAMRELAEQYRSTAAELTDRVLAFERDQVTSLPTRARNAIQSRKALELYRLLTAPRERPERLAILDGGCEDGTPWSGVVDLPMEPQDALEEVRRRFERASTQATRRWLFRTRRDLPEAHPLRSVVLPAGWDE